MLAPTVQKLFGRDLSAHMKTSAWIRREDWALDTHAGPSDGRRPGVLPQMSSGNDAARG